MATTPHNDPPLSTRIGAAPELGVELLPLPTESPADYLARLKALHARVGALIGAIETRRPILGPVPQAPAPRRHRSDRRELEHGERRVLPDRRMGLPDERAVAINRRFGPRDRRRMPVERREDYIERRRDPSPVPWQGRFRLDGTAAMWVLQVLAWTAVAAVALIYGIGR
jgi:hypothetical protein